MQQRTIALVGGAALAAALAVGTLATGFAQGAPQPGFGPGGMMNNGGSSTTNGFGPGGMMGGQGGPGMMDTSAGLGAFELLANPQTGAVFPEMGPNMMWNTQYGHMAGVGMMGGRQQQPTGQPTVSADQAQQLAQQWLDQNQPGSATEAPDTFPGYYTFHFTRDGQISGMLSINAFTGAVWYHSWHGAFVSSTEA